MALTGKDYCNCEHAQMLFYELCAADSAVKEHNYGIARGILWEVKRKNAAMRRDYEALEGKERKG